MSIEKKAVERFLGSSMKLTQTVEKPSRQLVEFRRGEKSGFERSQDYLRYILEDEERKANG